MIFPAHVVTNEDPFPVGSPVSQQDVVDRAAFIDQLVTRLTHRHSVILAARYEFVGPMLARHLCRSA